jgi:hypothetical protein
MSTDRGTPQTDRKPYDKPAVRQVALRPEEAVLAGCKSGSGGPTGNCMKPSPCSALGS